MKPCEKDEEGLREVGELETVVRSVQKQPRVPTEIFAFDKGWE